MRLNNLSRSAGLLALALNLCVTVIASDDEDDAAATSPDFTNINHVYSYMPDETYFPLAKTPPIESNTWIDEMTTINFPTTPKLDYLTSQKMSTFSVYGVSSVSRTPKKKETTEESSTSATRASISIASTRSPQRSTLKLQTSSYSTQTSSSMPSRMSLTSTASNRSKTEPTTTIQTSPLPDTTTARTSMKPAMSTNSHSYTTPSSSTVLRELSTAAALTTVSSTFTSSSSPTTSPTAEVVSSQYCNKTRTSQYQTQCLPCNMVKCRPGDIQDVCCSTSHVCAEVTVESNSGNESPATGGTIPDTDTKEVCRLGFFGGCRLKCMNVYEVMACCLGYWGISCEECPGGHKTPCTDQGVCTLRGTCNCKAGFKGTACEICEDSNKYGLNCSQDCLCEHGICNNGMLGDGSCDCESGYKGDRCETVIPECDNLLCHSDNDGQWRCAEVNGTATCICARGYDASPDLTECTAHNPCNDPVYPCGNNSRCEQTGPNQHNCTCEDGYAGDGLLCLAINPCQTNRGGCEQTAECRYIGPNKSSCACGLGYENYIPGTGCSLVDVCNRTSCDPNAICKTIKPLVVSCTCKSEYTGNGTVCYGNILERIKDINNNNPALKDDLTYAVNILSKFYEEPLSKHGPFTIFVPNDRAFREVIRANRGFDKFLDDEDRAMQILRQHILIGRFRLTDLQSYDSFYTLQGNAAQLQIKVARDLFRYKLVRGTDRGKILAKDLIASNGVIHIVNNLLTLEPEISGDKTKTAMNLIKLEGTYNRFESLIMSAGLADVFTQSNITVFAPENRAWDDLPPGTLDYLMKDEEGLEKLKVILKNHVFPGVIGITHLINTPSIKSLANVEVKVSVSSVGQVKLDGNVVISQANIPCSTGLYHHVEGVILPSYMEQVLPNRCADVMLKEVKGTCLNCDLFRPVCPQTTDISTNKMVPCRYFGFSYGNVKFLNGCSLICNREVKVPKCCSGFFGSDCMPCPGGFRNPCNGRGQCSESMTGLGVCYCEEDYTGTACEQCRMKDVFGPNCTKACTCLYGQCDEGPNGTGQCKKRSCQLGYQGDNCDQKLVPCFGNDLVCHAHAKCFLDNSTVARCQCQMGYEGDGDECKEIDPCQNDDNGGCHQQATCTKVGPGVSRCSCNHGWFGDGFECLPRTPCQNHTDCDPNAKCFNAEPGQYHCVCMFGYKGDGKTCGLLNLCLDNNGGCHSKAICTPVKAGERNCSCPENLLGDGFTCYGTIAEEVMGHPNLTRLAGLLKTVSKSNSILDNLEDRMTLFAPSDAAMESFMAWFSTWNRTSYWQDEENVIWFLNFHTVYNVYSTQALIALEGVVKSFNTMYDGFSLRIINVNNTLRILVNHSDFATISEPAVVALNGQIHIIDKVLEPFLPDDQVQSLNETLASQPRYQLFYQAMQITGVLEEVKNMDEFTVFVPTNDAIKQLNRTVNAEIMKFYIVPKLVLTPSIADNDMFETLLGPQHKLLMTVTQNSIIKVNGVQITKANILFDVGVIHEIDGVLHPILNRCDFNSTQQEFSECGDCTNITWACPQGYFPYSPPRVVKYECSFKRYPDAGWLTIGCKHLCFKNISELECCGGYFGPYCKDCPGGAENPCSGHGRCNAGLQGNGTCFCEKGFSGTECDRCDGPKLALPYCNVTYDSCGYRNGNCSENAVCNDTSTGVSCSCRLGYVGDGYTCKSQCEILDNGGCHPQADCVFNVSKLAVQCTCKQGFHGNGTWCSQNIDPCASDNGGCNLERAVCIFMKPKVTDMFHGNSSCECKKGFTGDGKLCIGDIMDAISSLPKLRYFYTRLQEDETLNNTNVTHLLSDHNARTTVFLPVSTDWNTLDIAGLVVERGMVKLPPYPAISDDGINNVEDSSTDDEFLEGLETMNGQIINVTTRGRKLVFANNVRVVQANIDTINGILHLTEVPIVKYEQNSRVAASRNMHSSNSTVIIVCVVVLLVVMVVALVGAIIYIKKHQEGFFKMFKRTQSSSDSNISFARLNAQEEEEDAFKAPDNARYDNPIFNDPDLL